MPKKTITIIIRKASLVDTLLVKLTDRETVGVLGRYASTDALASWCDAEKHATAYALKSAERMRLVVRGHASPVKSYRRTLN